MSKSDAVPGCAQAVSHVMYPALNRSTRIQAVRNRNLIAFQIYHPCVAETASTKTSKSSPIHRPCSNLRLHVRSSSTCLALTCLETDHQQYCFHLQPTSSSLRYHEHIKRPSKHRRQMMAIGAHCCAAVMFSRETNLNLAVTEGARQMVDVHRQTHTRLPLLPVIQTSVGGAKERTRRGTKSTPRINLNKDRKYSGS